MSDVDPVLTPGSIADLGGGGGVLPPALAGTYMRVLDPVTINFDTPGLTDGVEIYTPVAGEFLMNFWVEIDTAWNGTGPQGNFGTFVGTTNGLLTDGSFLLDMATADSEAFGAGTLVNPAPLNASRLSNVGYGADAGRMVPTRLTAANPLKLVVSQDGLPGGADPGSTQGSCKVYLEIASPVDAIVGATGPAGAAGAAGPAEYVGVWDSGTGYTAGQVVTFGEYAVFASDFSTVMLYQATGVTTGDQPDSTPAKWTPIDRPIDLYGSLHPINGDNDLIDGSIMGVPAPSGSSYRYAGNADPPHYYSAVYFVAWPDDSTWRANKDASLITTGGVGPAALFGGPGNVAAGGNAPLTVSASMGAQNDSSAAGSASATMSAERGGAGDGTCSATVAAVSQGAMTGDTTAAMTAAVFTPSTSTAVVPVTARHYLGGTAGMTATADPTSAVLALQGALDLSGLTNQGAPIADAAGGGTVDAQARAAINAILAVLRDMKQIAT